MPELTLFKRFKIPLIIIGVSLFLVSASNYYLNQKAFFRIFGFSLVDNSHTLKADLFSCLDCDAVYITFKPSKKTFDEIVNKYGCEFDAYDYRKHGDRLGGIMSDVPGFWAKCPQGNVCNYKHGGLWYNSDTGLMCYGHILLEDEAGY
jgi:hypothetical protein